MLQTFSCIGASTITHAGRKRLTGLETNASVTFTYEFLH